MKTAMYARKPSTRGPREDGDATKARIVEAAGRLFAEQGYAETTNKEIAEVAESNITGINYHFGSREGLYETVVRKVSEYMLNPEYLARLGDDRLTDREKLELFIDYKARFDEESWQPKLWAREIVAPSSIWLKIAKEDAMPKLDVVSRALSRYTGIPADAPELQLCLLNFISPVLSLLMINHKLRKSRLPLLAFEPDTVASHVKDFIFAGIDKMAEVYARKDKSMPTPDAS